MAAIRWGIIGCGDVTEVKSGPAFRLVEDSALVAVMRRDAAKAADYAKRHGVSKWYSDADALLNDPDINAVYIATPPDSHKEYVIKALQKGLHVYVEKPVTLNAAEARQLAEAAAGASAKISVAHYRRGLPMFLFIKDLLARQAIGDVRFIQLKLWQPAKPPVIANTPDNWRIQPHISGGGYFHDLAPHQLDLMLYYFGKPIQSQGFSMNQAGLYNADDMVSGQIVFEKNSVFTGTWCFCAAESETADECAIIGSKGSIRFPIFGNEVSWVTDSGKQHKVFEHPRHIQQPMIKAVVDYFKGAGPNPCAPEDAITVMEMIDSFTSPMHK